MRHLRNLRDKKKSQEKSVYICEICGTKFSSDFTDESEGSIAYQITHGFARIFGRWPMAHARYVLLLFFGHADFSSWEGLVPQISQIYTDFSSWDYFLSHRFHRYTQIFLGTFFCHADFADDADFYLPIVLPLFLFFFFFFLIPNRSFSPLKSFFMIRPKP